MATSRITGTNETIRTFDTAGGKDYTTLNLWEADTDNDLVTATVSEVLQCYGGPHDVGGNNWSGATVSALYRRILENAPNQNVVFSYDHATTGSLIVISGEAFSTLQGVAPGSLTFTRSNVNSASNIFIIQTSGPAYIIGVTAHSIGNAGAGQGTGIGLGGTATNSVLANCLVYGCKSIGFRLRQTIAVYNCTSVGNDSGYTTDLGAPVLKNCLGSGNTTVDFGTGFAAGSVTNASSDTSAPGTGSRTSQTFTFVGGSNYHLSPADAGAKGFGTDLSADATFPFDDDYDGDTRPIGATWDIGFDETTASNFGHINNPVSFGGF